MSTLFGRGHNVFTVYTNANVQSLQTKMGDLASLAAKEIKHIECNGNLVVGEGDLDSEKEIRASSRTEGSVL